MHTKIRHCNLNNCGVDSISQDLTRKTGGGGGRRGWAGESYQQISTLAGHQGHLHPRPSQA